MQLWEEASPESGFSHQSINNKRQLCQAGQVRNEALVSPRHSFLRQQLGWQWRSGRFLPGSIYERRLRTGWGGGSLLCTSPLLPLSGPGGLGPFVSWDPALFTWKQIPQECIGQFRLYFFRAVSGVCEPGLFLPAAFAQMKVSDWEGVCLNSVYLMSVFLPVCLNYLTGLL